MKIRFLDRSWHKTLSFAVLHLLIAVMVGYALTKYATSLVIHGGEG